MSDDSTRRAPLPPPNGYETWLDFACAMFQTRGLKQQYFDRGIDKDDRSYFVAEDFRGAARAELAALRATAEQYE